jgi:hypothetical protein
VIVKNRLFEKPRNLAFYYKIYLVNKLFSNCLQIYTLQQFILMIEMQTIQSPFSDRTLYLQKSKELLSFREESFEIVYHFYEDEGFQFTTTETDEINLKQLMDQYFKRFNSDKK